MNLILKDRMKEVREVIKECDHQLELAEKSVNLQRKTISSMEKMSQEYKDKLQKRIGEINTRMEENHDEVDEFTKKISRMKDIQQEYDEMKDMRVKISHNLDKAEKDLKFYWGNDNCPTCNQVLMDKTALIEGAQNRQKRFMEGLNVITDSLNRGNRQIKELKTYAEKINANNHEFKALQNEMNKLLHEVDAVVPDLESEQTQLKEYEVKLSETEVNCSKVNENHDHLKIVGTLLKDGGIKSKIIKKFIPVINKSINKYLQSMDFFINFTLDEEFNEVIKSRFRDEFSYASFSEGEKQKIDLALLFTWREIAKLKNSASTNLLILDEVFDSSLDDQATDELLKILRGLGENVNLFVISHKGELLLDKFETTLKFEKANDFSKLAAS